MHNQDPELYALAEDYLSAIMHFEDGDPNENPWVSGKPRQLNIEVDSYNPEWPRIFTREKSRIISALGDVALNVVHIGSTAVPGLSAKPVIDIDLIVARPGDEHRYIPPLTSLGYIHTVREPSWYEHRMLYLDDPEVNLHVFPPSCPEHLRHLLFRDWLIRHPEDVIAYEASKLQAKNGVTTMMDYNQKKSATVRNIYHKIFTSLQNSHQQKT